MKRNVHECDVCHRQEDSIPYRLSKSVIYSAPKGWLVILGKDACSKQCGKELVDMEDDSRCCPTCGSVCDVCGDQEEED